MKKIIIKAFMLLTSAVVVVAMERHPIIVLNGSSCAGKSSIAHHLQEKLGSRSIVVSYDDFRRNFFTQHYRSLRLLPDDYTYTEVTVFFDDVKKQLSVLDKQEKKSKEIEVGNFYKKTNDEFYKHIRQVSQMRGVIVDALIFSEQQKEMIEKQLDNNLTTVFVHVPFNAIVERIKKRNVVGVAEARYANRVLFIYPQFYAINTEKNIAFDGHVSLQEIESTVEQAQFLPYSPQFPTGQALSKKIIESFGLQHDGQQKTKIIPRLSHDYIIDTSSVESAQCALMLYNQIILNSKFTH